MSFWYEAAHGLILDEVLVLRGNVIVLADPNAGEGVLAGLALPGPRLDAPARRAVDGLLAGEPVIVLIDVALFQILEAEIGAEESRGAILQGDAAVASDGRSPHPLVAGAVGMIDHQQRHAFDFRRRGEADHQLAVAVRRRGARTARTFGSPFHPRR